MRNEFSDFRRIARKSRVTTARKSQKLSVFRFTREAKVLQSEKKETVWNRLRGAVTRSMISFFDAFPERQILIRTDGRVRFFVFRSWLQIAMAGVMFLLAGTILFISVGVVLQGRIIAA